MTLSGNRGTWDSWLGWTGETFLAALQYVYSWRRTLKCTVSCLVKWFLMHSSVPLQWTLICCVTKRYLNIFVTIHIDWVQLEEDSPATLVTLWYWWLKTASLTFLLVLCHFPSSKFLWELIYISLQTYFFFFYSKLFFWNALESCKVDITCLSKMFFFKWEVAWHAKMKEFCRQRFKANT